MTFLRHHSPRCLSSSSVALSRLKISSICSKYRFIHDDSPRKTYYITTPIFYPNASPHIGHLYSLVTGDVFARYKRLKGLDVRFLAGTDEHGLKIQKAARVHFGETGREREFCDSLSERFRDLARRANVSNTCFMRTSSKEHHTAVEDVWRNLYSKGYIYKSQYSGWYSITDECFYTDSQVEDGHSLETGSVVEWSSEENYMFRLSAFRDVLLAHYISHPDAVYPPQYHENVLAMLGASPVHQRVSGSAVDGADSDLHPAHVALDVKAAVVEDFVLADISISRPRTRLEWGVQVPEDPEQTVYVWFDALLIYLTGAGYPWPASPSSSPLFPPSLPLSQSTPVSPNHTPRSSLQTPTSTSTLSSTSASASVSASPSLSPSPPISSDTNPPLGWQQGWPADIQVIGKDILRFHAIYFPAILLALSGSGFGSSPPPGFALPRQVTASASQHQPQNQTQSQPLLRPQTQPKSRFEPQPQPSPISLPKTLLTHAHWTSAQKKMSKSLGNVADPIEAMERWGADVVRFYLMRVGGRWRGDVDWSSEQLDKHHKEIQAQLGNYFLRIASPRITERARALSSASPDGNYATSDVPDHFKALFQQATSPPPAEAGADTDGPSQLVDPNVELLRMTLALPAKVESCMDRLEAGQALAEVMSVLKVANKTLTDIAPWSKSTDPALVQVTRIVALETLRVVGVCLTPFMPGVAERLLHGLGLGAMERLVGIFGQERDGKDDAQSKMQKIRLRWAGREVDAVKLF